MPRWLALLTLVTAVVLILVFTQSFIISMAFPAWVAVISIYILVRNRRSLSAASDAQGGGA
jgi:L-asparagine transporter-like permease